LRYGFFVLGFISSEIVFQLAAILT